MLYLDTNTCIYFLNGKYMSVREHLTSTSPSEIKIPAVVAAELLTGAFKSKQKNETVKKVNVFLKAFKIQEFGIEEALAYAKIRASLEKKGTVIGPNDLLIAATALSNGATLVTNNTKEFERVEGLMLTNWVED